MASPAGREKGGSIAPVDGEAREVEPSTQGKPCKRRRGGCTGGLADRTLRAYEPPGGECKAEAPRSESKAETPHIPPSGSLERGGVEPPRLRVRLRTHLLIYSFTAHSGAPTAVLRRNVSRGQCISLVSAPPLPSAHTEWSLQPRAHSCTATRDAASWVRTLIWSASVFQRAQVMHKSWQVLGCNRL